MAKDPPAFESVEGLTEDEKEAIRNEVLHKWRQPKQLFFTIILCSIGAAVQGWDQTGSNGANLSFPVAFGISDGDTLPDGSPNPDQATNLWLVGLINAAPYIASAFLGCWMSDPLNNYFGRRGTIFFSAAFCCLSVIGSGLTQNWWQLFITRILLGIGMGSKASTVPIFCAENAPASVRGGLVMCWQVTSSSSSPLLIPDQILDVDSVRYLPGFLRQPSSQGYWCHLLETSAWLGLSSCCSALGWCLFLSR